MAKCKHETKNGRCGLKESYAYRKECHTEEFCRCHDPIEPCGRSEPIINADRIRAMTDEELADWMAECNAYGEHADASQWLPWLKQPAE